MESEAIAGRTNGRSFCTIGKRSRRARATISERSRIGAGWITSSISSNVRPHQDFVTNVYNADKFTQIVYQVDQ
jgi:hypothetical protein